MFICLLLVVLHWSYRDWVRYSNSVSWNSGIAWIFFLKHMLHRHSTEWNSKIFQFLFYNLFSSFFFTFLFQANSTSLWSELFFHKIIQKKKLIFIIKFYYIVKSIYSLQLFNSVGKQTKQSNIQILYDICTNYLFSYY